MYNIVFLFIINRSVQLDYFRYFFFQDSDVRTSILETADSSTENGKDKIILPLNVRN